MRSTFIVLLIIQLLGCASYVPRNKENACYLLRERYDWQPVMAYAEKRWKIPAHTILAIIYHESKFKPHAAPPKRNPASLLSFFEGRISSAYGYAQALDGTWEEYKRHTKNYDAKRTYFNDSVDFIGWYLDRSARQLKISRRNAYHLYLAYHEGNYGFKKRSFERKPSIKRYARRVQRTAVDYMNQINSCHQRLAYISR